MRRRSASTSHWNTLFALSLTCTLECSVCGSRQCRRWFRRPTRPLRASPRRSCVSFPVPGYTKRPPAGSGVWHEQVRAFRVSDADTGAANGYLFIDPHPREGKYSHACMCSLVQRCGEVLPSVCFISNFTADTPARKACLTHDEVTTAMHELGHCLHDLLSKTELPGLSGTSGVETDFVETPSQLMENFAWQPEFLRVATAHFETGEPMPEALIERLVNSRKANAGLNAVRQLFLGLIDMTMHTVPAVPAPGSPAVTADWLRERFVELREQISFTATTPGTCMLGSFDHLVGGYAAGYYSYMYALVCSTCVYATLLERAGPMDSNNPPSTVAEFAAHLGKAGREMRDKLLRVGGSIDGDDIAMGYLGCMPTPDALLRIWGVEQ
eukprot:gnl/Ergobibamus_cyprinoides/179.p1 GENE.gnl/Ergobibamus_cyprinoides/179~~gnl/Ergobibamus_cyprinoides/179.p1  ORF type:complete len:383 (+),score=53.07 gnl/Ergobibamus_cyprinoides/179:791-1939(+)